MTCIVAIAEKGTVYMGGDSAGVGGLNISIRNDEKVFINGPFIIGFTTSFRMGQLLHYKFDPPKQTVSKSDMAYMVTDFIDAVRDCFSKNGFGSAAIGGSFLVGYKGVLYTIDSDYQVGVVAYSYDSVGCGGSIALGSLYSSKGKPPEQRLKLALDAASQHSAGVAGPFLLLKLKKD